LERELPADAIRDPTEKQVGRRVDHGEQSDDNPGLQQVRAPTCCAYSAMTGTSAFESIVPSMVAASRFNVRRAAIISLDARDAQKDEHTRFA